MADCACSSMVRRAVLLVVLLFVRVAGEQRHNAHTASTVTLEASKDGPRQAFVSSFMMIIVSELGDKTFFIAALLAMRHDRLAVLLGAGGALAAMTVLSAGMGLVLPAIMPREYTHWAAMSLFVYFGMKLFYEAYQMFSSGEGVGPSGELQEVEHSLKEESRQSSSVALQAFTLTFLAEWGDRSQIATIALAAAKSPFGVTLGGIMGHGCCTSLAVIGGRVLASRISERVVLAAGGVLFLAFAAHGAIVGSVGDA